MEDLLASKTSTGEFRRRALAMTDVANSYASGQCGRLSVVATCARCTPEQAGRLAIQRARERYPATDWSQWTFSAEEFGFGRQLTVHYTVDARGEPVQAP